MARQPIFNRKVEVVAYEMLFRQYGEDNTAISGDTATVELLDTLFTQMNVSDVIGDKQAFVNFTERLINTPPPYDKKQLVVEVLEDIEINDTLVANLQTLSDQNYTIALDDFQLGPNSHRILPFADIVKLDVLALNQSELEEHVKALKQYDTKLLAEKVETKEMFNQCMALGFELFQGFFLCKPETVVGKKIPASKMAVLNLISRLQDPLIEFDELEAIILKDPSLSFKTLKLVNSPCYMPSQKIESLARAITYLGLNTIRSLVSMLALSNLSDKPSALKDHSVIRAKMCELLGNHISKSQSPIYFSVGLLSTLDAFFDQSITSLVNNMSLRDDLVEAILSHENVYGEILDTVIHLQKAEFEKINFCELQKYGISPDVLNQSQRESINWYQTAGLSA